MRAQQSTYVYFSVYNFFFLFQTIEKQQRDKKFIFIDYLVKLVRRSLI